MVDKLRENVKDFFSMLEAEVQNCKTIQGILFFGSYTREGPFKDIDIIPILAGPYETNNDLIMESNLDRAHFEWVLTQKGAWGIPEIQLHYYFGVLQKRNIEEFLCRNIDDETRQVKEQVRSFYEFYEGFNTLEQHQRAEYGINKLPSDFRFSPEHTILIQKNPLVDEWLEKRIKSLLEIINKEYENKVATYLKLSTE